MKTKPTAATPAQPVTDVTPTAIVSTDGTALTSDAPTDASAQLVESYMELGSLAWKYYGSLLDQTGFKWAAWWLKWDPEERLAQQISAPVPGMSTALELGKTFYQTGADMQARWLEAWQRFFTMAPYQSALHGDTGGALQAAATVE